MKPFGKNSSLALKRQMIAFTSEPALPAAVQATTSGRRTLLIVDDEEGPRQALNLIFKEQYRVLLAASGLEAIERLRDTTVDAAILDIRMAAMNGIELLERLKAIDPSIEVIMLTAYESTDTIRQALRLGASDYLSKPFDLPTIRAAVANAIEKRTLSQEIRSNNQKLAELQAELQSKHLQEEMAKAHGEIHASIIHDINGPLTVISGLAQIINQRVEDSTSVTGHDLDVLKDRLRRILRQVTNCIEISHRYLSFLREHTGEIQDVNVNQLLRDLLELLKHHPSAGPHKIQVQELSEDIILPMHSTDLMQILLNLGVNALQAAPEPHSVEIAGDVLYSPVESPYLIQTSHDIVLNRENFSNVPPILHLCIKDNGPGISQENLPRVFETYFSTKPAGQGTGLGLSIVQRLVKEARGTIHLHSESGKGTTFHLFLPALPRRSRIG